MAGEYVGNDSALAQVAERAAAEHRAAEEQAFADKLAKRLPPDPVEHAEIEKARKRTKPARHALLCTSRIAGKQEA